MDSAINLDYCAVDDILKVRKALRREFAAKDGLREIRIAVLGGSTTNELVNLFELLLLSNGFRPVFYQSEYGQYYEDAVHGYQTLIDFRPDLVYIHTSCRNIQNVPPLSCSVADLGGYVDAELSRYREIWDSLDRHIGCQVIQNNFEIPPVAALGNLDAVASGGMSHYLALLNIAFADDAASRSKLLLQDVQGISARFGLRHWFDWDRYFGYKILFTVEAHLELARSLNALVKALYGKTRKVLVLDLDNTLWGGVIGDDGVDKIVIGRETPLAEAYTAFHEYCLSLRNRGILLAVCSKNNEDTARSGFRHPSSILKLEHFSAFKANWSPKHENMLTIAQELNLGVDSFVFVDDNPAEREIVAAQLPGVAVPNVGSEVTRFIEIIEKGRYFEAVSLSKEDLERATLYAENSQRTSHQSKFANYGEYLDSLEMTAEIRPFAAVYMERISQLINKTNQFNLTTRRYTLAEMQAIAADKAYVTLYGRLIDRFGDNGLVSVVLGRKEGNTLHMDLWLMSCRVLKRDMELAMLDALVAKAHSMSIDIIVGTYIPTTKNQMVADFYPKIGFLPAATGTSPETSGTTTWTLDISNYQPQNKHIKLLETT